VEEQSCSCHGSTRWGSAGSAHSALHPLALCTRRGVGQNRRGSTDQKAAAEAHLHEVDVVWVGREVQAAVVVRVLGLPHVGLADGPRLQRGGPGWDAPTWGSGRVTCGARNKRGRRVLTTSCIQHRPAITFSCLQSCLAARHMCPFPTLSSPLCSTTLLPRGRC